eukprot:gnl/Dysnectes_brevis/1403_a1581_1795.p3 GENE.gnl/Dysnectes_brevis/1403_a1581_1795~~gnl/Dysnectes_brevis/1403_a1581_1795.p3  ORF type:complete len:251 (+),score=52.94 gnl/Dysnectes_brevis/1403_a1581_1795:2751-3503(+)
MATTRAALTRIMSYTRKFHGVDWNCSPLVDPFHRGLKRLEHIQGHKKAPEAPAGLVARAIQAFHDGKLSSKVGHRDLTLLLIVFMTCARPAQLQRMTITDVAITSRSMTINIPKVKHQRARKVKFPLPNPTLDIIRDFLRARSETADPGCHLFISSNNDAAAREKALTVPAIRKQVAKTLAKVDPTGKFTAHSLRRGAAQIAADADISIDQLKTWGGWSSEESMLEYIRGLVPVAQKQILSAIEAESIGL